MPPSGHKPDFRVQQVRVVIADQPLGQPDQFPVRFFPGYGHTSSLSIQHSAISTTGPGPVLAFLSLVPECHSGIPGDQIRPHDWPPLGVGVQATASSEGSTRKTCSAAPGGEWTGQESNLPAIRGDNRHPSAQDICGSPSRCRACPGKEGPAPGRTRRRFCFAAPPSFTHPPYRPGV